MGVHLGHVVHEGSLGCQEELEVWREGCGVHVLPPPPESTEEGSRWELREPQYLEAEQRRRPGAWGGALGWGALLEGAGSVMSEGGIL